MTMMMMVMMMTMTRRMKTVPPTRCNCEATNSIKQHQTTRNKQHKKINKYYQMTTIHITYQSHIIHHTTHKKLTNTVK